MGAEPQRYTIEFAEETDAEFSSLGPSNRVTILRAILKKLTIDPLSYGDPLRRDLAGYYKLRVGQFRVAYHVEEREVLVLVLTVGKRAAGDRENIYEQISGSELNARRERLRRRLEEERSRKRGSDEDRGR